MRRPVTRREFLTRGARSAAGALALPSVLCAARSPAPGHRSRADRAGVGSIGMRYQGTVIAEQTLPFGDVVAICDVDRQHAETARGKLGGKADLYADYRALLERKDVDVVTIGTPDHWHVAIAVAALRAGKDVYCEKPLTLTIDEGKILRRVVRETGRTLQVGSWQRSDWRFRLACELVQAGRIGRVRQVRVILGKNKQGGPFAVTRPPAGFDWEMWQGPTPWVPYTKERTHYTFRWWLEYSGGQMTDWGAHNIDIAQWGLGVERTGPVEIDGRAEFPNIPNGYDVPTSFHATLRYAGGERILVTDTGSASVTFEGEDGKITVSRSAISGPAVERLEDEPLAREAYRLYPHDNRERPLRAGKREATMNHMGNFFDCIRSGEQPISDVESQHRSVTACHLANISLRLGRPLSWDPAAERFPGDEEANGWLARPRRKGYEIEERS